MKIDLKRRHVLLIACVGLLVVQVFLIRQERPVVSINLKGNNQLERLQFVGKLLPEIIGKDRRNVENILGVGETHQSVHPPGSCVSAYRIDFDPKSGLETDLIITYVDDLVGRIDIIHDKGAAAIQTWKNHL